MIRIAQHPAGRVRRHANNGLGPAPRLGCVLLTSNRKRLGPVPVSLALARPNRHVLLTCASVDQHRFVRLQLHADQQRVVTGGVDAGNHGVRREVLPLTQFE